MDTSILTALFEQIWHSPACMFLVVGISIIAYAMEICPNINSKWIPLVCILLGPLTYWLFAPLSSVPATFPYPVAVLVVNGLIAGFLASVLHSRLTLWAISKFAGRSEKQEPKQNIEP
jgi:hypothetical protein